MTLACPNCGTPVAQNKRVEGLTRRESDVFNFVKTFQRTKGELPTFDQIMHGCGFLARSNAWDIAQRLVSKGFAELVGIHRVRIPKERL